MAGGSFTDGAVTGAYVYLFNHHAHQIETNARIKKQIRKNGSGATVYAETDGVGHVYVEVGGNVYSYGRYNGSDSPASGLLGPTGEGVLLKYRGKQAQEFIKYRTGKYPTVSYTFSVDAAKTQSYFDDLYNNGTPNGDKGVVIDTYFLFGNNCSTNVCGGLQYGGSTIPTIITPASFAGYINNLNRMRNGWNLGGYQPFTPKY